MVFDATGIEGLTQRLWELGVCAAIALADALEAFDRRPEFAAAPVADIGPFTCSKCGDVVDELYSDSTQCEGCVKGEPGEELWE